MCYSAAAHTSIPITITLHLRPGLAHSPEGRDQTPHRRALTSCPSGWRDELGQMTHPTIADAIVWYRLTGWVVEGGPERGNGEPQPIVALLDNGAGADVDAQAEADADAEFDAGMEG